MNGRLKSVLKDNIVNSTKSTKTIATALLNEKPVLKKIQDFSKTLGVPLSSAHRFIKQIGYPTFTHFIYDYNDVDIKIQDNEERVEEMISEAKKIASLLKNRKIYIITSRRAKSLGKFMAERLNDANIPCKYFSITTMNRKRFLKESLDGVLFIIDISGYSHSVQEAIDIAVSMTRKPKMIFISAALNQKISGMKYHFSLEEKLKIKSATQSWQDYNDTQLMILEFVHIVLKYIYINHREMTKKKMQKKLKNNS